MAVVDLFERAIPEPNSGCWLWLGYVSPDGYGKANARTYGDQQAHRAAWVHAYGPIEQGKLVCHRCDVRSCINPSHLFLGTHQDNCDDRMAKGRDGGPKRRGANHWRRAKWPS